MKEFSFGFLQTKVKIDDRYFSYKMPGRKWSDYPLSEVKTVMCKFGPVYGNLMIMGVDGAVLNRYVKVPKRDHSAEVIKEIEMYLDSKKLKTA
jgi:hypothetical protein